jgi:hypothetical protein
MDEKAKAKKAQAIFEGMVKAFNKVSQGHHPLAKKAVAERMMRNASPELKTLFMSRIDLS